MINKGKSRGQRSFPGQGSNPVVPSSQPVVIAMSYNGLSTFAISGLIKSPLLIA